MSYRSMQRYFRYRLSVLLAAMSLTLGIVCSHTGIVASGEPADTPSRLQVVLLNGGGQPASNFYSHFLHVKQFSDVLRRAGIPPADIAIFNADGADPKA